MRKIIIVVFLLALILLPETLLAKKDEKVYMLEETYQISPEGRLSLYTDDAEVNITGSDRKDVHVDIYHVIYTKGVFWKKDVEEFEMEITEDGGNLTIRELDSNSSYISFAGSIHEEYTIDIQVPSSISLKLRGDDDDYVIKNVDGEISLRFEDGDARISDTNSEKLEFESDDGRIDLKGGKGALSVYVEDGEFSCFGGDFTNIEASAEDGQIEISSSIYDDGFYRFSSDDGWIEFDIIKGGGQFITTFDDGSSRATSAFKVLENDEDRKVYRLKGGEAKVRMRTNDGRIKLSN